MPDGPAICPVCGAAVPGNARRFCPRCLWRQTHTSNEEEPSADPAEVDSDWLAQHGFKESDDSPANVRTFAGYRLEGELGRGGMGVVYAALQPGVNRRVALKILSPTVSGPGGDARRFQNEVEAASRLDHPNLLPVYEYGEHEGQWFYTMKLAEGGTLAENISRIGLGKQEAAGGREHQRRIAGLILQLSRALAYAHQRGILHRDLKPANILLDSEGNAFISDFGLAKFLEEDRGLTLTQGVVGTPGYMAPEQARGRKEEVTTATDVYGLGTIFYELLTGRRPFQGDSTVATLRQVVEEEVQPPRQTQPQTDRDLETICLKCLAKEPSRRYPTASALAEDLERWLAGEPISARPVSTVEGMWRWARRKPAVAGLALALAIVFLVGFLGTLWQWRESVQRAEESRRHLYAAEILLARQAADEGDWGRARALLARQIPGPGQRDLRGWEWHHLTRATRGEDLFQFEGHETWVRRARFVPGTDTVVSADRTTLKFWDLATRECLASFEQPTDTRGLEITRDGRFLFWGSISEVLRVLELQPAPKVRSTNSTGRIWGMALSPDDRLLALAESFHVRVLSVPGLEEIVRLPITIQGKMIFEGLAFAPDRRAFAYHQGGGVIRIVDLDSADEIALLNGHEGWVQDLCYSADGRVLVSAGSDGTIRVWDTSRYEPIVLRDNHNGWVGSVELSPDGRILASAGADHTILLWDTSDWTLKRTLQGQEGEVWGVDFSEDGRLLVSAGKDRTVRVWPMTEKAEPAVESHVLSSRGWFLSSDSTSWLTEAEDSQLLRTDSFSLETKPLLSATQTNTSAAAMFAFGGQTLATVASNGGIALRSLRNSEVVTLPAPEAALCGGKFSSDDKRFAFITVSNAVEAWNTDPPERILRFQPGDQFRLRAIRGLALSRDGQWLGVSYSLFPKAETKLAICNLARPDLGVRSLEIPASGTVDPSFSPDGRLLAAASNDAAVRLFRLEDGELLATLRGQKVSFQTVTFSYDGTRLAAGGGDGSIVIWDVSSLPPLEVMRIRAAESWRQVAFLAGDRALVALGQGDRGRLSAYVWRTSTLEEQQ